ncbi:ROK family protein [Parasphingorhabdus pacifica]
MRAGVITPQGEVLATHRVPTPSSASELDSAVVDAVRGLADRYPVAGVGLAVAGFVSEDRRIVRFAPHLAWRHAEVADDIARRLGMPVLLEHDANAAAVAEHRYGALAGSRAGVLVAVGTGIGGALVIDGRLFRGAYGVAPELGHLRLVPDGRPCPCGKRGCWERYCSGTALVTTALELLETEPADTPWARSARAEPGSVTGEQVACAAEDGDPTALRAMAELSRWLGEGLALIADVYDPDVVVIAGGVSGSGHLFLDGARRRYEDTITGAGNRPLAEIRTAAHGAEAAIIGSAVLAREHVAATIDHAVW